MTIIYALLTVAAITLTAFEVAGLCVYGWFIKEARVRAALLKNMDRLSINIFDDKIINIENGSFISAHPGLLSKWYIADWGRVWRWSKASKMLDGIHAELMKSVPSKEQKAFPVN